MFTDIVGYTALMGNDEDKAFETLKRNHTIHVTLIKKHNGKLIKEVGDGTLASFPLASDAGVTLFHIQRNFPAVDLDSRDLVTLFDEPIQIARKRFIPSPTGNSNINAESTGPFRLDLHSNFAVPRIASLLLDSNILLFGFDRGFAGAVTLQICK